MTTPAVKSPSIQPRYVGLAGFLVFLVIAVATTSGQGHIESRKNQLDMTSLVQPQLNLSLPAAVTPNALYQSTLAHTGKVYVSPIGFKNVSGLSETFDGSAFVVLKVEKIGPEEATARAQNGISVPFLYNGEVQLGPDPKVFDLGDPTLPQTLNALYESFCHSACNFVTYDATFGNITANSIRPGN